MSDVMIYKFETHAGLPPDGEKAQFFGFDAGGWAYILRWMPSPNGYWLAIGYDANPALRQATPKIVACRDEQAGFIVSWATAPLADGHE